MKKYDVVSICNALVDILVQVDEETISNLELNKGIMHLVDTPRQNQVLEQIGSKERTQELGGSCMNAIRSLAALGSKTVFAGSIGYDEFGDRIRSRLHDLGIVEKLIQTKDDATGSCVILITPDGERTMNTNLGASRLFDEGLVPEAEIKEAQVFHFAGYQWDSDGQIKAIEDAISVAKQNGTKVSFDVADPFVCERNRNVFVELIAAHADIVFANKEEARLLYGDSEKACEEITRSGAVAVMKLGADGAFVGKGNERFNISPVKTSVVDTTAAGDMFAAGFLYGYTKGWELKKCGQAAAILAADVISRVGASVDVTALDRVKSL